MCGLPRLQLTPLQWGVIAWLIGCGILQQTAELPHPAWLVVVVGGLVIGYRKRWPVSYAALILGWGWALGMAWWMQPAEMVQLESRAVYQARGVVVSLPKTGAKYKRFLFRVNQLQAAEIVQQGDWLVWVSWFNAPTIQVGTAQQLALRIKPVQTYHNPGGWDYAGWLYHQGVRYTAYVVPKQTLPVLPEQTGCCQLQQIREHWRDTLQALRLNPDVTGVLLALTLGDRSGLTSELKQIFAATGTSHLMAISGLHIGLAAAFAVAWVAGVWRRIPRLSARYPAILAGTIAGWLTAVGYTAIAGWGLPAQRALIMLSVFALAILQRRTAKPMEVLAIAAFAVVLVQPAAILSAGYWLSFGAVTAIIWTMPLLRGRHWLWQAMGVQLGISLMLYPLLLLFGMPISWLAPMINIVLVPVFAVAVVPLSLLGVLSLPWIPIAGTLLNWLAVLIQVILDGLTWLADKGQWTQIPPIWELRWVLLAAVIMIVAPLPLRWRSVGLVVFCLGHLPYRETLGWGDYRMTVLDVGQGLSVVVQTQQHTLVYDTGAAYSSGFNLADAVLLPYLREQGVAQITTLVLSHGDNDHDGAASVLVARMPVQQVIAGEPDRTLVPAQLCMAGQQWEWDGVEFAILHPGSKRPAVSNNASCVLRIRNAAGATLLTGDIKAQVERQLLPKVAVDAPYQLVVVPHHGSLSSSSEEFVQVMQARQVVYPVGAMNRYGFPKAAVVARWQAAGAEGWRTDQTGALNWLFSQTGEVIGPTKYKIEHQRYWH